MREFIPNKFRRNELKKDRLMQQVDFPLVDLKISKENIEDYLNEYKGRIFFWSFTISKARADDMTTKFRVVTHQFVPEYKILDRIHKAFPNGCVVKPVIGYRLRHTFDVTTFELYEWWLLQYRIVRALEDLI